MLKKRKKKRSVSTIAAGIVAGILTVACCICVLTFLANGVMGADVDSANAAARFERATVSAIVEEVGDKDGEVDPLIAEPEPAPEPEPDPVPEPEPEPEPAPDNKTISFFGDSITTYSQYNSNFYTTYPYGDVDDVNKTWWMQVADRGGYAYLSNSSSTGSCVVKNGDFSGQSAERVDFLDANSGTVIVFMGMNDYTGLKDLDVFEESYVTMLSNIKSRCTSADIVCCTVYPVQLFEANRPVSNYNDIIRRVATDNGCKVVDLAGLDMSVAASMTGDGVHPTYNGMTAIADLVLGVLQGSNTTPNPKPLDTTQAFTVFPSHHKAWSDTRSR